MNLLGRFLKFGSFLEFDFLFNFLFDKNNYFF